MVAFFLIVLLVPTAIAGLAFVMLDGVTLKEFGLVVLMTLVVAGSSAGIVSCANTHDVEVWNGWVTQKERDRVSCSHSYTCNCHAVSCGKDCTTTVCSTCYEHSNDWDWNVHTSNGETITINRIDRQGVHEPPRFTAVVMGEPTSLTHSYKNYIKASPGSLFRHQGLKEKYASSLPAYPQGVYDYHRLDRLVLAGATVHDAKAWNNDLSRINAELGRKKQVNMIVVVARDKPRDWYYALEESWIGGKKNDVILVVSVDSDLKPQWAEVMTWTTNELFKVKLRDDVMDMPNLDRGGLLVRLSSNVETFYQRKPMKDFEYLSSSITPSSTQWVLTLLIATVIALGMTWAFQVHDVFGEEGYGYMRRRRSHRSSFNFPNPFRRRRTAWQVD